MVSKYLLTFLCAMSVVEGCKWNQSCETCIKQHCYWVRIGSWIILDYYCLPESLSELDGVLIIGPGENERCPRYHAAGSRRRFNGTREHLDGLSAASSYCNPKLTYMEIEFLVLAVVSAMAFIL